MSIIYTIHFFKLNLLSVILQRAARIILSEFTDIKMASWRLRPLLAGRSKQKVPAFTRIIQGDINSSTWQKTNILLFGSLVAHLKSISAHTPKDDKMFSWLEERLYPDELKYISPSVLTSSSSSSSKLLSDVFLRLHWVKESYSLTFFWNINMGFYLMVKRQKWFSIKTKTRSSSLLWRH